MCKNCENFSKYERQRLAVFFNFVHYFSHKLFKYGKMDMQNANSIHFSFTAMMRVTRNKKTCSWITTLNRFNEKKVRNMKRYLPKVYRCWHSGFLHSMVSPAMVHCSTSWASFSRWILGRGLMITFILLVCSITNDKRSKANQQTNLKKTHTKTS